MSYEEEAGYMQWLRAQISRVTFEIGLTFEIQ